MVFSDRFLQLSNRIADAVQDRIRCLVGTPCASDTLYIGADGTPTKYIDDVAEQAILDVLIAEGISLRVISEECGERNIGSSPEFTVIIDPIDGTYNACTGIPFYSLSLAFRYTNEDEVCFGYVNNLATGDIFYAHRGCGAFLNGEGIRISDKQQLREFCVSVYGSASHEKEAQMLCKNVRRIRTMGSVALELCYVAAGKFDALVDMRGSLRLTDVAAGKLIIEEAGATITDGYGAPLKLGDNLVNQKVYMVASNGHMHKEFLKLLAGSSYEG